MDEYIENLLQKETYCDILLPHFIKRLTLEENGKLEPRVSALEEELAGKPAGNPENEQDKGE